MILLELLVDLALNSVLEIAACKNPRYLLRHTGKNIRDLCL